MIVLIIILAVFAALGFNFALYRSVEKLYDDLPKWLHIVLLIPPASLIAIIVIAIVSITLAIYDTIKNL